MVLDETAKKQLIERLKAGRAKKKAEKEALQPIPKAPKLKPQPKPRKQEYKDLTKVVEEEPLESDDDIVEVVPEPIKVVVPEPVKVAVTEPVKVVVPEPKVAIAEPPVVKPQEAIAKTKKQDKDRFLKVIFYKQPTKRQLKIIDTIDASSSDEEPTPPKIVKKAVAKIPKTPRPKSPTAEEKHQAYLKKLADEWF